MRSVSPELRRPQHLAEQRLGGDDPPLGGQQDAQQFQFDGRELDLAVGENGLTT